MGARRRRLAVRTRDARVSSDAGHQEVDVAEDPLARIVVGGVGERHALEHARIDAGTVEHRGRVEQQPLDAQRSG